MSTTGPPSNSTAPPSESSPRIGYDIRWRSWPAGQRRGAILIILCFAGLAAAVQVATASPAMEFLAVLAAGLAGWRILVPIEFTVDEGGVQQQWLGRRRYDDWNSFRGFSSLPNGFILWPPGSYCPLDAMRGLYLPCVSQKAELADLLRRYLAEVP